MNRETRQQSGWGPYYSLSWLYDSYDYPKQISIDNNGSSRTDRMECSRSGRITRLTIGFERMIDYTYYVDGTVRTAINYERDNYGKYHSKFKYTTTANSIGDKPEYATVTEGSLIRSKVKYEYDTHGELSATKTWTNDTNADGELDENDDIIIAKNSYSLDASNLLSVTSYMENICNPDGQNEGTTSNTYNINMFGSPVSKTDSYGNEAYIEYDDMNRPVKYTYANGAITNVEYNFPELYTLITTPDGVKKKNIYDKLGRIKKVQRIHDGEINGLEEYTYDNAGRIKTKSVYTDTSVGTKEEYSYDILDRITEKRVYSLESKTPLLYTETYTYAGNDPTVTTLATDGAVTASRTEMYDYCDRLTSEQSEADGVTLSTSYSYDAFDRVISSKDAKGNVTQYEYDCNGNVTKTIDAEGNETTTEYDLAGRVHSVTDSNGNTSYTEYDKMGRVIRKTTPFTNTTEAETKTYYDKNSNVVKTAVKRNSSFYQIEEYRYDNMGNLLASIANDGTTDIVTQYEYDDMNRITKRITGLDRYSENPQGGSVTSYVYGSDGFLDSETNPLGEELLFYEYDYVGNVKYACEDYAFRIYTYGPFGLTSEHYYLRGDTQKKYTYNNLGQLVSTSNSEKPWKENTTTVTNESYTYDGFGRVSTHTTNDGSVQSYKYDANSNVTEYELAKDGVVKSSIAYEYNSLNRLTSLTKDGTVTSYTYDSVGNLTSKINNNGTESEYAYNNAGLVTSTKNKVNNTTVYTESSSYYLNGLKYQDNINNGDGYLTSYYSYDKIGRLSYEYKWNSTEDICLNRYSYDLRGNRTRLTNKVTGEVTEYTYNDADRLLQADTTVDDILKTSKSYTYDERGNLTEEYTSMYSDDGVSEEASETKLYSYDRFYRLTKYSCGDIEATYEYNTDGLRTSKTVNGTRTNFVWSGSNLMYEYGDGDDNTYAYDGGGIIQSGTDTYLKDGHGNVISKYDSNGNALGSTDYDAYGNIISGELSDSFGYCGEYRDSESGLIYLRNRYYDSTTGCFITEDPAKDGTNWYSYCAGNPVTFIDPWGFERLDEDEIKELRKKQSIVISEGEEVVDIYISLTFNRDSNDVIPNSKETYRDACIRGIQKMWSGEFECKKVNCMVFDLPVDNDEGYKTTNVYIYSNSSGKTITHFNRFYMTNNGIKASEGNITIYAKDYTANDVSGIAAHEVGHVMGVGDIYDVLSYQHYKSIMNEQWAVESAQYCDYMMMFMAYNTGRYLLFSSSQNPKMGQYENTMLQKNRELVYPYLK